LIRRPISLFDPDLRKYEAVLSDSKALYPIQRGLFDSCIQRPTNLVQSLSLRVPPHPILSTQRDLYESRLVLLLHSLPFTRAIHDFILILQHNRSSLHSVCLQAATTRRTATTHIASSTAQNNNISSLQFVLPFLRRKAYVYALRFPIFTFFVLRSTLFDSFVLRSLRPTIIHHVTWTRESYGTVTGTLGVEMDE